jgi:2,4-dienoyl-CoA reductase-like NADH-dependent reductase (Old Yellow Enzyme family)
VIAVGGFRSRSVIGQALESIDAISVCRPLIRQPDLANLFRDGITDKADCISCGKCHAATMESGLACGVLIEDET